MLPAAGVAPAVIPCGLGEPSLPPNFVSATQPLSVWLRSKNFHYTLDAVQRGYEWKKVQVDGLLDTIAQIKRKSDRKMDDAVVKLSEVVVLEVSRGRKDLASPNWYEREFNAGARQVTVVDGQQRITTVVIIAAVAQLELLGLVMKLTELSMLSGPDSELRDRALQAVRYLEESFTYSDGVRRCLLVSCHTDDQAGLAGGIFDFCSDGNGQLAKVLEKDPSRATSRYEMNAIYSAKWFKLHLDACTRQSSSENVQLKIKWLLGFLQVLLHRVLWTTTLTFSPRLALDTFLNVNLGSHRVTLSEWDVVKVTLVASLGPQRDQDSSLTEWNKCSAKLIIVAEQLAMDEIKLPYLKFLSKGKLANGATAADALKLDFLRHVCFIQEAASGAAGSRAVAGIGDGLVQHFADFHMNKVATWNAKEYIQHTLLQYVWAFCSMLMRCVHGEMRSYLNGHPLHQDATVALSVLLSLSDTSWRPAAMAIIREISESGMRMERPDAPMQKLLAHALKQLEIVALRLAAHTGAKKEAKVRTWVAIVKSITEAGLGPSSADRDRRLTEVIGKAFDNALMRMAFTTLANLPKPHRIVGSDEALFQDLFQSDLYPNSRCLATAVLLGVELFERSRGVGGGGMISESRWEGDITLEHLLPQNFQATDGYWNKRVGASNCAVHTIFEHKLGNLSILTRKDNSLLGNRDFDAKLILLEERDVDLRTLDFVKDQRTKPLGWNICAILNRQEGLLRKLATRYGIEVHKDSWHKWQVNWLEQVRRKAGTLDGLLISDSTRQMFDASLNVAEAASGSANPPGAQAATRKRKKQDTDDPASEELKSAKRRIQLKNLVLAHKLQPGRDVLCLTHQGHTFKAELLPSGCIFFDHPAGSGKEFDSLSRFCKYALQFHPEGLTRQNPNGWEMVRYSDRILDEYRSELAQQQLVQPPIRATRKLEFYIQEHRERYKRENPGRNETDLKVALKAEFETVDQSRYKELYEQDKLRHRKEWADYVALREAAAEAVEDNADEDAGEHAAS